MWIITALMVMATTVAAFDNFKVAFQWKQIDFEYPRRVIKERQAAIKNHSFIAENIIPMGIECYKNRLFITLPRLKNGVPASLAVIDLFGKFNELFSGSLGKWDFPNEITKG
jgi:hypothetical protein